MHKVSESLAGRALYLNLEPMTIGERETLEPPDTLAALVDGRMPNEATTTERDPLPDIVQGFMPGLLTIEGQDAVATFWESYVATYLERDLRQLSQIDLLPDYRRLMEAVALRSGQVLNQAEVSRDIKVSQASISRYLNLLETTNLIHRVPAFSGNRTSRIIKSPKVYWLDSGLGSFLAGYYDAASLKGSREAGFIFECAVFLHLRVLTQLMKPKARIYYWRTVSGNEVDFIVEHGRKILPIEVKLTGSPSYADGDALRYFLERHKRAKTGIVIHAGSELKYLSDRIIAIPWTYFTGNAAATFS